MDKKKRSFRQESSKKILQAACITGLVLSTVISIPLLTISIISAGTAPVKKQAPAGEANSFTALLEEFDRVLAQSGISLELNRLDSLLNDAEKKASNVESHLSVLKRRRILAVKFTDYRPRHQQAAARVQALYPYSEPLAMIAGEAILLQKNRLDGQDQQAFTAYTKNISSRYPLVLLGFHLFNGTARDLSGARGIPQAGALFSSAANYVNSGEQAGLVMDSAILQVLAGNKTGAISLVNKYKNVLFEQPGSAWFTAELLYDFDTPKTTAAILGIQDYPFVNSQSIIRLADTLCRMDNIEDARFFWNLLTYPGDEPVPANILEEALYNLASTSTDITQRKAYLDRLLSQSPGHLNGLILYSRLMRPGEAIPFLNRVLKDQKDPLIELELIKQNRGFAEPGRTAADTWLLLGRYPSDPRLYEWASFYFEEMQMRGEADQLRKTAGYNQIGGTWLTSRQALEEMQAGNLDHAEALLKSIPGNDDDWETPANLGLIMESRRSMVPAMDYYETAASRCGDKKNLALIQVRIARCLRALDKPAEAARVLEYAQDLDPDNLRIRLEIRRGGGSN